MPLSRRRERTRDAAGTTATPAPPSLSVVITVASSAAQADRLLALMRPHARELIAFADTGLGDAELALLQAAAPDRLVRIPLDAPLERALGFMLAQATCDWILWLDAEEVPSRDLLDALPELIADERHLAHAPRQAWLWPDAGSALSRRPWAPRAQPRLLRNLPALWRVPGTLDSGVEIAGPVRIADHPLYVTTLLSATAQERRERLAERERLLDPGATGELERLRDLLLAEDAAPATLTGPVPGHDRELIESVLHGPARIEAPPLRGLPPTVSQAEVDAHWQAREPEESFYEARIAVADDDHRFFPGERRAFHVALVNEGASTWPWGGFASSPEVRVAYRWLDPAGADVVGDGPRTALPGPVAPGERVVVGVAVQAPAEPGPHVLEIDMVHEGVRWFRAAVRVPVDVG